MIITSVSNSVEKSYFNGNLIFPEKITPNMQKFKDLAADKVMNIINDAPFDLYVREIPNSKNIGLTYVPTGEPMKMSFFMMYELSNILHSVNDKILLEKVAESMDVITNKAKTIVKSTKLVPEDLKNKIHRPLKIGQNSQIKTKAKSKTINPRRKH